MNSTQAWHPDPYDSTQERWWDGQQWTPATRPRVVAAESLHAVSLSSSISDPAPRDFKYSLTIIVALVASIGLIVGSIGPWATFMAFTKNGIEGDGAITLIAGALAAMALFKMLTSQGRASFVIRWASAVAGAISIVIALVSLADVASLSSEFLGRTIGAQVGWGLWLVLLSAVVLCFNATTVAKQSKGGRGSSM